MTIDTPLWDVCGNRIVMAIVEATDEQLRNSAEMAAPCFEGRQRVADGVALFARRDGWWRTCFYNPDGSFEVLCGNSLLGAARVLLEPESVAEVRPFERHPIRIARTTHALRAASFGSSASCALSIPGMAATLYDTGSPHAVLRVPDVDSVDLPALARHASRHVDANVTIWSGAGVDFRVRTFERGVEAETRACGTGALAAALAIKANVPVTLRYDGGTYRIEMAPDGSAGGSIRWQMEVQASNVEAVVSGSRVAQAPHPSPEDPVALSRPHAQGPRWSGDMPR